LENPIESVVGDLESEEVAGVDMVAVVGIKEVGMTVAIGRVTRASVREEREARRERTYVAG
jgi:hypothetical protein